MATLPTNIDATYEDDETDPSVKEHQQYHDVLHTAHNGIEQISLGTTYINADHVIRKMYGGTYTPQSDRLIVEVGYSGKLEGVAHMSTFFAWNQSVADGTDLLTGESFVSGLQYVAGTTYRTVGPAAGPGHSGDTRRRILIEGLTPGTPMVWEVDVGATGYKEDITTGQYPVQIAFNSDSRRMYATWYTTNELVQYDPGNRWELAGVTRVLNRWTINSAYGVAMNPLDDSVVYASNNVGGEVYEIDVEDGTTLRTFTVANALYLEVSNDGTTLYVGTGSTTIVPITLSSGAVGAAITVGGYGGQQKFRAIGDYIITPCTTGERIDRITVADGTVTTLAMPVDQQPRGVSAPKGEANPTTFWACVQGVNAAVNEAFEVDLATMTKTGAPNIPSSAITGAPRDIAVSPTGQALIMVTEDRYLQTYALPSEGVLFEYGNASGTSASFVILDTFGGAWIARSTTDILTHFHCAKLTINPTDEFWGGYADVFIEEA